MNFELCKKQETVVVSCEGEVRITTEKEFHNYMETIVQDYCNQTVVLDMQKVSYLNSGGIGIIVDAFASFREKGGTLVLSGLSENMKRLFELSKLNRFIEIFSSVDAAMAKT